MWNSLSVDLRDPGLSLHSFRTKLKCYFFTVDRLFFSLSIHILYYCSLFAVRANVMFISWRVQMSELNWIDIGKLGDRFLPHYETGRGKNRVAI